MKIFLVILFVALSRSFPTLGGYESIDVEKAQSDPQIQSFIDDGLKAVVADGIKSEQFQSANFHLSKINSIMRQEDDGQNYKFDCYFMNDEGYTMRANFDINYKPDDDNTTVTNYSYKVQKGSLIQNVESQYSQVKYDEFENSQEQQNLVTYGIDDMIKKCIAKGYLPDLSYRVSSINWVYRQVYGNSIFYKCNVDMSGQDIGMNANFTVYYQPTNDNMTVVDYACDIKSQQYGDKDVYANTATIAPIESEYTKVPPSEWQNNAIAKEVLEYGAQQINKIAVEEGKIPDTDLSIGEVTSAESQIAGNGIYYRFKCKLTDEKGVTVWANYTVYYDAYSTEKDITSYWYESEITAQDNGEQEQEQQNDNEGELFISIFDEQGEFQPGEIDFVDVEEAEISVVSEQEEEPGKGGLSIFDQVFPLTAGQEPTGENVIVDNGREEQDLEQDILIIDEGNVEEEEEQQQQQEEEPLFIDIDEGNAEEEEEEEEPLFIDIDEGNVEQGVDEEASVSSSDDFQRINTNEVQTDQKTSAAFQYGVDQVTQKGKDESKIPNYDYSVTDITEAYKKTDASGDYYKFRCQASSDEGSTLWLTFTVYYDGNSQDTSLVTYNYRVRNNAVGESETPVISTEDDYVECTEEEIQGDTVQGALNYGIAQVYGYVQQERNIPVSEYSLSNVNSVYKQETSGGTSYKCDVVLENDDQDKINAQFTVYHDESSGKNSLSDYSYDIPDASEASEEANVGDDDLYKDINLNYLNLDDEYTQMLLFAIDVVIQKGYAAEKIPKSEYKISNIDYVKKRNGDDGENYYKCGIELQDANKITISIKFTASIKMSDDYKKLWDWSYSVSDMTTIPVQDSQVPDSGYTQVNTDEVEYNTEIQDCIKYGVQQIIPNPQDYTLTKINSVYRQVIDSAIYYKYNIQLTGDQKSADLSCTVYYKPDSGVKDVWAYSYSSKTSSDTTNAGNSEYQWWTDGSWESTSDSNPGLSWNSDANYEDMTSYKYDRLDVSQVQNNQKYHEALEYGVQQCLQNLVDNKVIANTNYNVDEVEDAYVQDNNNYENCKMKVKLSNSAGISLDMDFNVQYQSQGDDKTVTSYSVQGTSQGSSDVLVADYNIEDGGQLQIGNCEKVYPQQTEYPSSVQGAIDYGVSQVVDQVEQNENEDYSGYEVKEVKNVYQEVVNPDTYRVEAMIENPEGSTIDCNFMVKYQPNADNNELVSYNYITY